MTKLDSFTIRRLAKFADDHRERTATLPTLKDFESAGIPKETVDRAVRDGVLVELYVTLNTGAVVKGYKAKRD